TKRSSCRERSFLSLLMTRSRTKSSPSKARPRNSHLLRNLPHNGAGRGRPAEVPLSFEGRARPCAAMKRDWVPRNRVRRDTLVVQGGVMVTARLLLGAALVAAVVLPAAADTYQLILQGKVVMHDGSPPPKTVSIERICSDSSGSAPGPIANGKGEYLWR